MDEITQISQWNPCFEQWESVDFPMINQSLGGWENKNNTMSSLKRMLLQENLVQNKDFIFQIKENYRENRCLTVRFKDEGQGLICLIKWVGSNTYKGV